jgi:hypothetical protein
MGVVLLWSVGRASPARSKLLRVLGMTCFIYILKTKAVGGLLLLHRKGELAR